MGSRKKSILEVDQLTKELIVSRLSTNIKRIYSYGIILNICSIIFLYQPHLNPLIPTTFNSTWPSWFETTHLLKRRPFYRVSLFVFHHGRPFLQQILAEGAKRVDDSQLSRSTSVFFTLRMFRIVCSGVEDRRFGFWCVFCLCSDCLFPSQCCWSKKKTQNLH